MLLLMAVLVSTIAGQDDTGLHEEATAELYLRSGKRRSLPGARPSLSP
jgi:hypothetical protein